MAIFYPVYWAFWDSQYVIELTMRDPRLLIGLVSAIIMILYFAVRCLQSGRDVTSDRLLALGFYIAVIYLGSYILWEKLWSIYRYLAIQESLSGVMLAVTVLSILARRVKPFWIYALLAAIMVPTVLITHYPWWSRAQVAAQAVAVKLPALEPDAMMLFLDSYAYSYLVPSFPETVRVIGANNNLVRPGSWGTLQAHVEAAIDGHQGPFWGMEYPEAFPGIADATLSHYRLVREGDCTLVDTNIEERPLIKLCRLKRGS
jgi:hypothetical protein